MKFLELTGFGNKHKHLVSLRSIADIEFGISYTQIFLTNGGIVNVIENEKEIIKMINYQNGDIVGTEYLENLQAQIDAYYEMEADHFAVGEDDELPF
jgi:hypothetical protein